MAVRPTACCPGGPHRPPGQQLEIYDMVRELPHKGRPVFHGIALVVEADRSAAIEQICKGIRAGAERIRLATHLFQLA
jgi:hypothetical protein